MPTTQRFARRLRFLIATLCAVTILMSLPEVLLSPVSVAHADSSETKQNEKKAKKHFRQGQRMFAMGRFRPALESYEKAYTLSKYPDILFNMAQCYRNLGDYESAVFHFRTYLEKKPDAKNREAVTELITKLEIEMEEADRQRREEQDEKKPPRIKKPKKRTKKSKKKTKKVKSGPFYTRWWFWTGVVLAAGGGTGYYYFFAREDGGIPNTDLGNIDFGP